MKHCIVIFSLLALISFNSCKTDHSVEIRYKDSGQVAITNQDNVTVYLDVISRRMIKKDNPNPNDCYVSSRWDDKHYSASLLQNFEGGTILFQKDVLENESVRIYTIPSSFSENDEFLDQNGSNYIAIVETEDLRIAHLGEIGQNQLTEQQLKEIGEIDICFAPLENRHTGMDLENLKGFRILEQIEPKIIIPTFFQNEAIEYAATRYRVYVSEGSVFDISKKKLPKETTFIVMGSTAELLKVNYGIDEYDF